MMGEPRAETPDHPISLMTEYSAGRYDWSKVDTDAIGGDPQCRCIIELRARIETLEKVLEPVMAPPRHISIGYAVSDKQQLAPTPPAAPAGVLVSRVAQSLTAVFQNGPYAEGANRWDEQAASAAIREVAKWLDGQDSTGTSATPGNIAEWLRQEVDNG